MYYSQLNIFKKEHEGACLILTVSATGKSPIGARASFTCSSQEASGSIFIMLLDSICVAPLLLRLHLELVMIVYQSTTNCSSLQQYSRWSLTVRNHCSHASQIDVWNVCKPHTRTHTHFTAILPLLSPECQLSLGSFDFIDCNEF